MLISLLVLLAIVTIAVVWLWPRSPYGPEAQHDVSVQRLPDNPLIHADLDPSLSAAALGDGYVNINWPSLLRVPQWIDKPLGKYYLYFSHHKGDRMRLAYADDVKGPWRIYEPGVLPLSESGFPTEAVAASEPNQALKDLWQNFSIFVIRDYLILNHQASVLDQAARAERGIETAAERAPHIASPEVVVDRQNERLLMFYHGLEYGTRQLSRVAESVDGIHFSPLDGTIPSPYLRSFNYGEKYYLLGMPGILFRADNAAGPFKARRHSLFEPRMRHMGVWLDGATLHVFWSRVGDAPESILLSRIDLNPSNWNNWKASEGVEIMRPETDWEGADLGPLPSLRGELAEEANELRDPYVFEDDDHQKYLLYVGRGEKAIGIAKLGL